MITCVLQNGNRIGDEGAKAIAQALKGGAKDTTLHVRVPGKPVETIGLDCVTTVVCGYRCVASCI